ncbi:MAG: hypothetical protein HRS57_01285, partial [Mycoplasmataceae bacterium]|nr:hypothetical protein [Mycoplasmataceae bacterium]
LIGIIGIQINLIMDLDYMKYMGMGVAGAGVASFIGYSFQAITGFILALKFKSRGETNIFYNFESFKIKKEVLIVTLLMGAPFILRMVLVNIDNIMYVSSVNNGLGVFDYNSVLSSSDALDFQTQLNEYIAQQAALGIDASSATSEFYTNFWGASVGAYGNTYTILWMTITGLIQGTTSVLTYNYNQQNYSRTKQSTKLTLLYMVILATFMIALFEVLLPQIMMIFKVTIINSANIYFVGVSLSRMIFVGLTFIPFIFILGTGNVTKSVIYTTIEGIWFIVILLIFDSTMSNTLNYYKIIPWTFAIAELSFIFVTFPYYFYKVHHLHRDDELNKIRKVAKDFSSQAKMSLNKTKLSLETEYSNEVKHQVSEYVVDNDIDSKIKTKLVYRNIYRVNKSEDVDNDLYVEELSNIWKDGSKKILDINKKTSTELTKLKEEEDKKYKKWIEDYKIHFVFKFAFTKDKENSKEAGQFSQEKEFLEYEKEVARREKEIEKKQKLELKELPKEEQNKIKKENKKENYIAKKDDKIAILYATLEGSKILFKDKYYDRKRIFDNKVEDITNNYNIRIKKIQVKITEDPENSEKYKIDISNLETEMDKEILNLSIRYNKRDISRKFDHKYEKASNKNLEKIEKLKSKEFDYKNIERIKIIEAKRDINMKLAEIKYNTKRYLNEN